MRILMFLLGCSLGATALAQTNVIDLKHRPVQFRDLKGKEYRVELDRATLDGVIYSVPGGGGMIAYSELSPEMLVAWGIPTNRIETAAQRARAKKQAKADYAIEAERAAAQRSVALALNQARAQYALRRQAAFARVKSAQEKVDRLRAQIADEKVQRDRAWNQWIYTDADYASRSTLGRIITVDNDQIRLSNARGLDRRIADDEEQLVATERDLQKAHKDLQKELDTIDRDYRDQVRIARGETPATANQTPVTAPTP